MARFRLEVEVVESGWAGNVRSRLAQCLKRMGRAYGVVTKTIHPVDGDIDSIIKGTAENERSSRVVQDKPVDLED